jgi:hypothetical protein
MKGPVHIGSGPSSEALELLVVAARRHGHRHISRAAGCVILKQAFYTALQRHVCKAQLLLLCEVDGFTAEKFAEHGDSLPRVLVTHVKKYATTWSQIRAR